MTGQLEMVVWVEVSVHVLYMYAVAGRQVTYSTIPIISRYLA